MRLIIIFINLVLFTCLPAINCHAEKSPSMIVPAGGTVTSPYGYRPHPIYGIPKYHTGVDIGLDYGDPIHAAADGVVIHAGWISGYGNTVIIDHGNSVFTYYAHNDSLLVNPGDKVSQGHIIATGGSSGNSTGPHLHFEVREGNKDVPPGLYCSALANAVAGDNVDIWNSPQDEDFGTFDFDPEYDYGKPIRDVLSALTTACAEGLKKAKEPVLMILTLIMTIDLGLSMGRQIIDEQYSLQKFIKFTLHKTLYYGFLVFLLFNWGEILGNGVRNFFTSFGAMGIGMNLEDAEALLSDPTAILSKGMHIVSPIFDQMDSMSGIKILLIPGALCTYVISMIFVIVLFILFTIIVFHIMKAHLTFYFTVLFSFCTWFFAGAKETTQYASNGINAIFASAVNLMFFAFFSLFLQMCLSNISCDALYTVKTSDNTTITYNKLSNDTSLAEFMQRIRSVESSGNYYVWDDAHESFGAYQINVSVGNWDRWCDNYINDGGTLDTDMSLARENEPPSNYPWTVSNQDKIAAYIMMGYYNEYGNWHDVAVAWNGGTGAVGKKWQSTEEYYAKVCGAQGLSAELMAPTLNLLVLLEILVAVFMFMLIGDRMHKAIIGAVGQMGFQLRTL